MFTQLINSEVLRINLPKLSMLVNESVTIFSGTNIYTYLYNISLKTFEAIRANVVQIYVRTLFMKLAPSADFAILLWPLRS